MRISFIVVSSSRFPWITRVGSVSFRPRRDPHARPLADLTVPAQGRRREPLLRYRRSSAPPRTSRSLAPAETEEDPRIVGRSITAVPCAPGAGGPEPPVAAEVATSPRARPAADRRSSEPHPQPRALPPPPSLTKTWAATSVVADHRGPGPRRRPDRREARPRLTRERAPRPQRFTGDHPLET